MSTLETIHRRAESDARTYGYYLNPNKEFLQDLLEGLKKNEERYGYPSCPCRLASGIFEYDRDIFCPCDYRDPDVAEYGACYCALYVRKDLYAGETPILPIPERRPLEKQARAYSTPAAGAVAVERITETKGGGEKPVVEKKLWYCRQCGYVVLREDPPYVCPVCKAKREFFAEVRMSVTVQG